VLSKAVLVMSSRQVSQIGQRSWLPPGRASEKVPEVVSDFDGDVHSWKPDPPLQTRRSGGKLGRRIQRAFNSSPRARVTTRFVSMGVLEELRPRPLCCTAVTAYATKVLALIFL
jgi:hypothetical protein